MKKFIFGVMLLVSLLGIVGCTNPSNSDGSENVVYTVKNGLTDSDSNPISMTISYKNKSSEYVNEQTIPVNGTYEIPANDAKIGTEKIADLSGETDVPAIYLKIKVSDTKEVEGFIEVALEKVICIRSVETFSGRFTGVKIEN